MKSLKAIIVIYGGFGDEREVSIKSGEQVINSLKLNHSVEAICLEDRVLPDWIEPDSHIVFPMIHVLLVKMESCRIFCWKRVLNF